jgi:hypothetical protein
MLRTMRSQEDFGPHRPRAEPARSAREEISAAGKSTRPMLAKGRNIARRILRQRTVEFVLASGLVAWVANYITLRNHQQDMAATTQNNAISAVSDIAELTNERRERAALVVSSIRRSAPKEETDARKTAYDEAYVRWNSKVPGDLLRIRASLNLTYESYFLDYVDGLTDAGKLAHSHASQRDRVAVASIPGFLALMDACLTRAYDTYRSTNYKDNAAAYDITQQCQFMPLYNDLVSCFTDVSRALYDAVGDKLGTREKVQADTVIAASCMPPAASLKWFATPAGSANSTARPVQRTVSDRQGG